LPEFSLNDREGKLRSIRDWHGKSLILNFWATWCAPCRREIPLLQKLAREWAPRDVATIGIAVDHRTEVLEFAARFHIDYPLLIGEEDALDTAAALGVDTPAFPFTVFTDRRGEVVAIFVGELRRAQADLILATVEDLNDDRLPLAAARHHISTGLRDLKEHAAG
jgi:thiol-disulfide isomerase/thioredoxin